MIKLVLLIVAIVAIAAGAGWLADQPGEVVIAMPSLQPFLGTGEIRASLLVSLVALIVLIIAVMLIWTLIRILIRSPDILVLFWRNKRKAEGFAAISKGMVAVGAGDARGARRYADEARRKMKNEPLAILLEAQAAQVAGDGAAAERAFVRMTEKPETKLLGLRGLYMEARRREDSAAARLLAEEAHRSSPALGWAGDAMLEHQTADRDWTSAIATLERNMQAGLVDRNVYKRWRAVLLTAQAQALEETDTETARTHALEAIKFAPTLVPAAALAARLVSPTGDLKKAAKIIETAWRAAPHPDLATAYAYLRPGDSTHDRLTRIRTLIKQPSFHDEGQLALSRAALDAGEFVEARRSLEGLLPRATQRVCMLMAEIEEKEKGDRARAREWMTRALRAARDPAWTTDGYVSDRWLPMSPLTGRLDAFEWKVPVMDAPGSGLLIEMAPEAPLTMIEDATDNAPTKPAPIRPLAVQDEAARLAAAEAAPKPAKPVETVKVIEAPKAGPAAKPVAEAAKPAAEPAKPAEAAKPIEVARTAVIEGKKPAAVVPLMPPPDDPGPGGGEIVDQPRTQPWYARR